ncbi:hypothetical protein THRCLA_10330 [Thraustotheca clavata]|uniref:Uncharacterized protein n=1 Tax=Thraustotheca clavata TaxID=74557 RepID=A0A1V9YRM8_9STRA|nr:hypothetical protein THRCLA_10330 [Thraustotheca clavata]
MDIDLICTSGVVNIGSLNRAITIGVISVACIAIATIIAKFCYHHNGISTKNMLPASALAFCSPNGDFWTIDASIACMCGIFRYSWYGVHYALDTKLWIIFSDKEILKTNMVTQINQCHEMTPVIQTKQRRKHKVILIASLLYLLATIIGSISYIRLSDVNFGNDFWWANFNSTGSLTFIANWYNKYRVFTPHLENIQLDNLAFSDFLDYSRENSFVSYSPFSTTMVQYEIANDIRIAIRGLRNTYGCLVPWIATQYCWLDFDQKYTMANSLLRQKRCDKYKNNGAVYLEAPLRNVKWSEFESCWGESFHIGIAKYVYNSSWLQMITTNTNSVEDEITFWMNHNITSYTTQWQNYKTIGLIDSFTIVNAFGISYSINLQNIHGIFRLGQETSMKMYWSFAYDLSAISMNGSGISGKSLLRESNNFAFYNTTLQNIYILNSTLSAPLTQNLAVFVNEIGSFGSVDLYHVPVPPSLLSLTQDVLENLSIVLAGNTTHQQKFNSLLIPSYMMPVPERIKDDRVAGGSFLCDQVPKPTRSQYGMAEFYSVQAACGLALNEMLLPIPEQVLFALIASRITIEQIPIACSADKISTDDCTASFESTLEFITAYMNTATQLSTIEKVQYNPTTISPTRA